MLGWSSPILPKLQENPAIDDNPLGTPITESEGSWIGSLVPLGAVFGSFAAGYVAEKFGRKMTLLSSVVPFTVGWAMIAAADNLTVIYVARVISGFALAIPFTVLPMYVGEIAEVRQKKLIPFYIYHIHFVSTLHLIGKSEQPWAIFQFPFFLGK